MFLEKKAAHNTPLAHWNFWQKSQYWIQGYRTIQAWIFVSIAFWGITECFSINNHDKNTLNWYEEPWLNQENSKLVHHDLHVFTAFCPLIHVSIDVSELTATFDCVFESRTRLCHCRILGFAGSWFRAFAYKEN